jgi:hypothetical protein
VPPLPDYIVAIFWLLSNALLGAAGWVTAARLFPRDAILTRIGHTIGFGWACIVLVSTILGATGLLWPAALMAGVASTAVLILVLVIRRVPAPAAADCDQTDSHPAAAPPSRVTRWLWATVWAVLFAFWAGHVVTAGLLRFPDDFDTLMYHLPLVDHWLQARSLYAPDGLRWSDPGNNELITLWLVAPFSGDFLYALTNLPVAVLLACASVELGRQLGLSASFRHLAGLAVVTNFVVFKQLVDTENDVAVAALFLACLAYALRYADRHRTADLIFGVACLGLLAGVKYYALGYAAVAVAVAVPLIASRMGWRDALRASGYGIVGLFLFGGYWYLRNWIGGGSPLHPLGRAVAPDEFDGFYPDVWQTTFVGNGRPELLPLAVNAIRSLAGPVHLLAVAAIPLTSLWLVISCYCRFRRGSLVSYRGGRRALVAATVGAGLILAVTPFAVEDTPGTLNQMHWKYCPVRYGMCFLSLAVLALIVVLDDISRLVQAVGAGLVRSVSHRGADREEESERAEVVAGCLFGAVVPVALVAGLAVQFVEHVRAVKLEWVDSLLIAANLLLIGFNLSLLASHRGRYRWVLVSVVGLICALGAAFGVEHLSQRWHKGFVPFYDRMLGGGVFEYTARNIPPGTTICVLDHRPYPFYGSARQFRVCQPVSMRTSYPSWEQYLRERQVRVLAARFDMGLDWRGWKNAGVWTVDRPDVFVPIDGHHWPYNVYRLNWNGK